MTASTHRPVRWVALLGALALTVTACNGVDDTDEPDVDEEVETGGEFSVYISEPQFLLPGQSTEVMGSKVLDTLFTGLVGYDPQTQEPLVEEGVAAAIESDDAQSWTIELEEGWTFHNGEEVTAQSFVDAWNLVVAEGQQNTTFFEIAGFEGVDEVAAGDADEMAGVEAVDEHTIEVTLDEPFGPFEQMIGYTAFYPLPEAAHDDLEAFEQAPIGNGPYMMDGEWEHDQHIRVSRFEDYAGEPGNADAVEFRIYTDNETAFTDIQAGNLDVLNQIPPEQLGTAEDEFGDRLSINETSSFEYLGFPLYQEEFTDERLRQALSLAIDREAIIEAIHFGTRQPATAVIPPTLPDAHRDDACEFCEHDPERAEELFEEAGGYDDTLTVYYNSGAGHDDWVEAVANQWQQTLGIDDIEFESLDFAEYLDLLDEDAVEGPFRLGWVLSYPSPQYALEPLYGTDAASNHAGYANDEFDDLVSEANQTEDPDEGIEIYQQAEDLLLQELPVIPLWYQQYYSVHSERVDNVTVDARTFYRIADIEVVDP